MTPRSEIATALWRFNPRLRTSVQRADGQPVVVVHDPASGAYFQLGEDEHAIAREFDGRRDLEAVRAACAAAGRALEAEELATFAEQLVEAGILVPAGSDLASDPGDRRAPQRPAQRGILSRLLHVEIAAFNPARFFAATVGWIRPLLGAPALALGVAAVLAAVWVTLTSFGALQESIGGLWGSVPLAAIWALYGTIILAHELGHGYVCAHYGGRVNAMGFLVLYGKPCAYCDVSDAWLMGKSQRLWIMAAGSLVELGLWALATLAWRITAPETALHQGAILVMTLCGLGTLFNFNPLIQYDGYYMLGDWLEIPNLRSRAFADLRARLLRQTRPQASERERRVFLWYGLVAIVYTGLLVGYLLVRLHHGIGSRWGTSGLLVLWGGIAMAVAKPAFRTLSDVGAVLRGATRARRWIWMGAGATLLAVLVFGRWPLKVSADCRVEPRARIVVRSPVDGTIESVGVREGDVVEEGQTLAQLAMRDLDFALAGARAEVEELDAKLALVESGPRRQEIELAQRRAEEAATRVRFNRLEHERATAGLASDLVSRQSVETIERELRLAEDDAAAANKSLELLQAGPRPEEVRATRARLEVMRAQVAKLDDQRARTRIAAPIRGQVLSPHAERLVGRYVERGDSLLVLADLGTVLLEIPVPEKEVGDVQVGAPVRFRARSMPNRTFEGRVAEIAPAAEHGGRQRTVLVRSELDNAAGELRAGTTGWAKIYCGERRLGSLALRRGVRTLRTEFWALW